VFIESALVNLFARISRLITGRWIGCLRLNFGDLGIAEKAFDRVFME